MQYITVAEAKQHLRVDFTDDDAYIASLIELVEELVNVELSGTFYGAGSVTTNGTVTLIGYGTNFADFAVGDNIYVEGEAVRTIATIVDDEELTVSLAFVNTAGDLIWSVVTSLPTLSTELPRMLKHAMLLMIAHFYAVREPVIIGTGATEIPFAYKMLIAPFKNWTIA
jgi:hypothetical protein